MKRLSRLSLITSMILLLSGCSGNGSATGGFLHETLVAPFTHLIEWTAGLFSGSYGLAIVLITLVIRGVLMPFMLKQFKNQRQMREKMAVMKPEMTDIQEKIKQTKNKEEQQRLQQEMMMLYRKHGVNPLSMGCLPLIIQMPILMGFYYAIRSSDDIATHNFLWFNLGAPDIPLALLAGVIYFLQFRVQQSFMPATATDNQQANQMMKWMGLISPAFILIISFNAPAALPLYWSIGGLFLIGQAVFANKIYFPRYETSQVENTNKTTE